MVSAVIMPASRHNATWLSSTQQCGNGEYREDVKNVGADFIANRDLRMALQCGTDSCCQLWKTGTDSDNGEANKFADAEQLRSSICADNRRTFAFNIV